MEEKPTNNTNTEKAFKITVTEGSVFDEVYSILNHVEFELKDLEYRKEQIAFAQIEIDSAEKGIKDRKADIEKLTIRLFALLEQYADLFGETKDQAKYIKQLFHKLWCYENDVKPD